MPDRRRNLVRLKFLLGFLNAPPLPPIILTWLLIRLGVWHAESEWNDWERWWLMSLFDKVFFAYLGAFFFAAPLFTLLQFRRHRRVWHFVVVGGIAGLMTEQVFDSLPYLAAYHDNRIDLTFGTLGEIVQDAWHYPENPMLFTLSGAVSALALWFVAGGKLSEKPGQA